MTNFTPEGCNAISLTLWEERLAGIVQDGLQTTKAVFTHYEEPKSNRPDYGLIYVNPEN